MSFRIFSIPGISTSKGRYSFFYGNLETIGVFWYPQYMTLILISFAALLLTVFGVVFIFFEFWIGIISHIKGAPYVRSKKDRIQTMVQLADIKAGTRVMDLGSGDGSILIEAAQAGAVGTGVEINPFLVPYSRWRIKRAGLSDKVTILKQDFRAADISNADVIFVYLLPRALKMLDHRFVHELKPGTRIVSNGFKLAEWTPKHTRDNVYCYIKES